MDQGAWWAAVYGVTQSRTWLKWLCSSSRRKTERKTGREGSQLSGLTKRRSCLKERWSVKIANFHVMRKVKEGSLPLYVSAESDQTKKPAAVDAAHLLFLPLLLLAAPRPWSPHLESSAFNDDCPSGGRHPASLLPDPSVHRTGQLSLFLSPSSQKTMRS